MSIMKPLPCKPIRCVSHPFPVIVAQGSIPLTTLIHPSPPVSEEPRACRHRMPPILLPQPEYDCPFLDSRTVDGQLGSVQNLQSSCCSPHRKRRSPNSHPPPRSEVPSASRNNWVPATLWSSIKSIPTSKFDCKHFQNARCGPQPCAFELASMC